MKPGSKDIKLKILITGDELSELQHHSSQMAEAFGLDRRIENYLGKRHIGLYSWDFDCLISVIEIVLDDPAEYPDKNDIGYIALKKLLYRLKDEYRKFD
ncbi:MAG: hypothetical protein PHY78_13860 [Desulfobacterales bacterium]|nr:hypothetical protein [Desulfobacterales bacterium]MDD4402253.1 hypothetical protein [Desulfitobacteriaceae bacterium]